MATPTAGVTITTITGREQELTLDEFLRSLGQTSQEDQWISATRQYAAFWSKVYEIFTSEGLPEDLAQEMVLEYFSVMLSYQAGQLGQS
jgi:hypothetical protein